MADEPLSSDDVAELSQQVPVRVVPWPKSATMMVSALIVSLLLMASSTVFIAHGSQRTADLAQRIETSNECRFDKNAAISDVNDRIDLWTARGLASTVRNDDPGVHEALTHIDELSDEFDAIIGDRSTITEQCD